MQDVLPLLPWTCASLVSQPPQALLIKQRQKISILDFDGAAINTEVETRGINFEFSCYFEFLMQHLE